MNSDKDETEPHTPPSNAYGGLSSIRIKSLQREQIISHIMTMKGNIDTLYEMSVHQLDVKLSLLERQLKSFEQLQMDLESLDESQISQNHRLVFEEAYFEVKSLILERLSIARASASETKLSSTRVIPQTQSHLLRLNLPTLQLSKFSGNYKDWLELYNMFRVLVHDNQDLSQISKFQYLRSCLTGSAARIIQSLEVTAQNYEHAIEKPSLLSLRIFIDNINASMRALESISSKQQIADGIILHLVVSKLDVESQAKWEDDLSFLRDQNTSATSLKLPSWNELTQFLERCCKTLEIFEGSRTPPIREQLSRSTQQKPNRSPSSKNYSTSFVTSSHQPKCNICDLSPSHSAFRCTKFVDMNAEDRFKTVKRLKLCLNCLGVNHIANSCPSLNRCQQCGAAHHTLLHRDTTMSPTVCLSTETPTKLDTTNDEVRSTVSLHSSQDSNVVILATAMIELCTPNGTSILGRALLDSCSQSNFITERMAQHLRLPRKKIKINICGIGDSDSICVKYSCTVTAKSLTSGFAATFDAVIISAISSCHPHRLINTTKWKFPANIKLADSTFNVPGPVDLLIGADLFCELLMVGRIKVNNQPNFIKTKLGWIVSGSADNNMLNSNSPQLTILQNPPPHTSSQLSAVFVCQNNKQKEENIKPISKYNQLISFSTEPLLENLLQSFWQLEQCEVNKEKVLSFDEAACEKYFKETTKQCPHTNKFIVRLPFKAINRDIGHSQQIAQRRFTYLEAKFARDKQMKKEYTDFIDEYIKMGHMSPISAGEALYHIPHHCVIKPESTTTRLRVVFDASCATTNGKSLNDLLLVGPTLQNNLFTILSRFRYHKFVLVADIAKMYRQILVDKDDMKWQCILWRENHNEPLQTYKLQTVTYGTSCAPYLAVKCIQQLVYEEENNYAIGSKVTLQDFYVDNLMTGGSTEIEVIEIKRQVTELLLRGGFPLRKFASNSETILADVPQSEREAIVEVENMQYVKTLGLKWSPTEDVFSFSYPQQQKKPTTTKRSILSHMASFFDPLGFINPIIVRCKMLIQDLWTLKLHWDESVPHDVFLEWKHIREELSLISQIKMPRYVAFNTCTNIHIFVDASKRAYGACMYAVTKINNEVQSSLLCAKSKVAPTKEVSLPRLELCAALLGSQLLHSVKNFFPTKPQRILFWSDSTITLSWIAGEPCRWPTFVANRVIKIQHLTADCKWRHVLSELNPADLLSRGTTIMSLNKPFWFKGPEFLLYEENKWPQDRHVAGEPEVNEIQTTLIAVHFDDIITTHKYVNNYEKLLRIFAYVQRFIARCRKDNIQLGPVCAEEMKNTLLLVCQIIQKAAFYDEIQRLESDKPLKNKCKLLPLSPFLCKGLVRVGGRFKNSTLTFSTKHPILLPSSHPYVWKFIPPRSPHFGGLWESAVKQAKHYIRRTVGNLVLTHDELHTVCCQTEAIINSRPLTPLSSDPNDLRALTPAHFLIGRPLTTLAEPSLLNIKAVSLKRYQMVQWVQQNFWDRWRNEYRKLLQLKTKWITTNQNLQVNDLVMLKEDNSIPLQWPLARVVESLVTIEWSAS